MELCSLPVIYLGPNCGGGNEDNGRLLQKVPCIYSYIQCPQPCSRPLPTHASAGDPWTLPGKSGSVSCGVTASFSWVVVHTGFCLCPPRVYFPGPYKFWQLYGGINGHLLQESLYHTQVCITQSPCPCSSPLLTRTSTGDTQTQFCLSLCGVSGSWCAQGLFEPSEQQEWSLILNANLPPPTPPPPSCLGFSFALGRGVFPQSRSSGAQPPLQHLPSCWGFSDLGRGISPQRMWVGGKK